MVLYNSEKVSETEGGQPDREVKINDASLKNIVQSMQKLCFLVETSNGGSQRKSLS